MWKTPCGILTTCSQCVHNSKCDFVGTGACANFTPNKQSAGASKWNCGYAEYSRETNDLVCYETEFPYPCACKDLWEELEC